MFLERDIPRFIITVQVFPGNQECKYCSCNMLLPVLKSRARAISELEGVCSILDMDTKVQLKRPLTSFAPAVIVLAGIAYAAPAPDIALALGKAVF